MSGESKLLEGLVARWAAIASNPLHDELYRGAHGICADELKALIPQAVAVAKLEEFDLILAERPIDSSYWDTHHRKELERLAAATGEERHD